MKSISRNMVLREMEIKEAAGKPVYFSIQFYLSDGEFRTIERAQTCGLRMDMSSNRMRGIQEYDVFGLPVGHIVPVSIDCIRTFNNHKVTL